MIPIKCQHELKILPEYFKAVREGIKKFELRKNDRHYSVGDEIILKEWNGAECTGHSVIVQITYILKDCPEYGLKSGYCILGWR